MQRSTIKNIHSCIFFMIERCIILIPAGGAAFEGLVHPKITDGPNVVGKSMTSDRAQPTANP